MPTVPRLDTRRVAPTVIRQPQTDAAAQAGAGVVAGLGGLAQSLNRELEDARQRGNEIRLNSAEVKVRELRNRILNDREKGVLNQRGENAFRSPEEAEREWTQGLSAIGAELGDPEIRQAFQARADQLGVELRDVVNRHVSREMDSVDELTTKQIVDDTMGAVAANATNADRVAVDIVRAEETVRRRLTRQGVPDEVLAAEVAKVRSNARIAQMQAIIRTGGVEQARMAFDAIKEEVAQEARTRIEATIKTAEEGVRAERQATRILTATDSPTERNKLIAELPIGERKAVRQLVEAEQDAVKKARETEQENAFAQVERAVVNGAQLTDPRLAPQVALLSASQRRTLENFTVAPVNDNAAWMEWYQLSTNPSELAKMTESQFRSHWSRLSTSHRDDAERTYREAKAAPSGTPSYITPQTVVARAMRTLGGVAPFAPLSEIPDEKQGMVAAFETAAAEELGAEKRAKGRDLTPSEMQAVVDRMQLTFVRETAVDPVRFGNLQYGTGRKNREEAMAFQMTPADTVGIFAGTTRIRLSEIPTTAISAVDNILRANRIPVNDTNREALYTIQQFDVDGSRTTRWLNDNRR